MLLHVATVLHNKEQEFADLAGDVAVDIIARRHRRLFYLAEGIPPRVWRGLLGEDAGAHAVSKVKLDHDSFKWLHGLDGRGVVSEKMLSRSIFQTTLVKQIVCGYTESSWKHTLDVDRLSERFVYNVASSNIIEHLNNVQANSHQGRGTMRWRRPERCHAIALSSDILKKRFTLDMPAPCVPLARKHYRLDKAAFGKHSPKCSLDLEGVCTTKQKVVWFSPTAWNVGLPYADLKVISSAYLIQNPMVIEHSFMGCFCTATSRIIFKRSDCGSRNFDWQVGLTHYHESAAVTWPVEIKQVPQYDNAFYLEFKQSEQFFAVHAIESWDVIVARSYRFRAWSWQLANYPNARPFWKPSLRAFVGGIDEPLRVVACRFAFWDWDKLTLVRASAVLKVNIDPEDTLLEILYTMIKDISKADDATVLQWMAPRLVSKPARDADCTNAILDIDEASACLERDEIDELQRNRRNAAEVAESQHQMQVEFRDMVRDKKKGGGKGAKKAKVRKKKLPNLEQAETSTVKALCPPGAVAWKSRGDSGWHIQVKNWVSSINRSVRKYGDAQAILVCLSVAWWQHSVLHGTSYEDAPHEGLLSEEWLVAHSQL